MNLFKQWADRKKQRKLDARRVFVKEIDWIVQLPVASIPRNIRDAKKSYEKSVKFMGGYNDESIYRSDNSKAVFSAPFDKFNLIAGSICKITGFTTEQIYSSREDCKGKLIRLFSHIPQSKIERSTTTCIVGGIEFEQHSFLVIRNGKPIFCMEYIYQVINDHELAISMTHNNETWRQEMFNCLKDSEFSSSESNLSRQIAENHQIQQ